MKVIHLKSNNDHQKINMIKKHMKTKPCIVFIVAPWCGFCQRLQPTIDTLENELVKEPEFKRASLITVHDDQLKHIDQKVNSFPTIRMFKQGRTMPDYSDEFKREADDIRNYMRKHMNNKRSNKKCKTFRIKKKYKIKNYNGPGSDDDNWMNKTFSMFGGGKKNSKKNSKKKHCKNCECTNCKNNKYPSLKKQMKSNPWMKEILTKKANGEKLNSYDKFLYESILKQPLPPGGIKKLLRMYKK